MTPLYIFDLDGTLADLRHRLHHVRLLPGSKVKAGGHAQNPGIYRGVASNQADTVWVEFEGTGKWAYHANDIKLVKNWNAFHAACVDDKPIAPIVKLLHAVMQRAEVRIWSGRMDTVRLQTTRWLGEHSVFFVSDNKNDPRLQMRPAGNTIKDDVLKEQWLHALSPEDRARLVMVFDDRQRVVDMWRRNGVVCAQVAPGDF